MSIPLPQRSSNLTRKCNLTGQAYPPACPRGCVRCAEHRGIIWGLRSGAKGRVAAGELLVAPFEAGVEVEEGQHEVTVLLPRGVVPLLVCAVVGYDLRQRYAKRLGHRVCVRRRGNTGRFKVHLVWPQVNWEMSNQIKRCASHVSAFYMLTFWSFDFLFTAPLNCLCVHSLYSKLTFSNTGRHLYFNVGK